jgi:hypothetical protein
MIVDDVLSVWNGSIATGLTLYFDRLISIRPSGPKLNVGTTGLVDDDVVDFAR